MRTIGAFFMVFNLISLAVASDQENQNLWRPDQKLQQERIVTIEFQRQPAIEGEFGPPDTATGICSGAALNPGRVDLLLPAAGVSAETGIVLNIGGLSAECPDAPQGFYQDETLSDEFNLIIARVFVRNLERIPADYGRYKVTDAMRGLGAAFESYPQINRRRVHAFGGSGGGLVVQQLAHLIPGWASVTSARAITLLTTRDDVAEGGFEQDPFSGWGGVNGWGGDFLELKLQRFYQSPLLNLNAIAVDGERYSPYQGGGLLIVDHGTADDIVDYQHFLAMKDAVAEQLMIREFPLVNESNPRFDLYQSGEVYFVPVLGEDHNYDSNETHLFIEEVTGVHPFTVESDSDFPADLNAEIESLNGSLGFSTSGLGWGEFTTQPLTISTFSAEWSFYSE